MDQRSWTRDLRRRLDDLLDQHRQALSFLLTTRDTIESVRAAHQVACQESRHTAETLGLDQVVAGRKVRSVWAIYVQMLRELAQHCGHADILREQILAARRLSVSR